MQSVEDSVGVQFSYGGLWVSVENLLGVGVRDVNSYRCAPSFANKSRHRAGEIR